MNIDLPEYIKSCLDKYDKNNDKYKKMLKLPNEPENDKKNKIIYFKNDNKIIYKNNYEVIGFFYKSINLWIWGWAFPTKEPSRFSKKLFEYGFNTQIDTFIKTILCNSRIKIKSKLELDIFLSVICDIGKMFLYKKYYANDNIITFIKI